MRDCDLPCVHCDAQRLNHSCLEKFGDHDRPDSRWGRFKEWLGL